MIQPEKRAIDGVTFEVTPLGHKAARAAFVRVAKAVGPALGQAGGADPNALGGETLAAVMAELVQHVSDEDLDWFSDVFGKTTRFSRDGQKWPFLDSANREHLFQGRILLFFKWLAFALEVNYSDFFGFLRSAKTDDDPADPPADDSTS